MRCAPRLRNPWIGRALPRLYRAAGLVDIPVLPRIAPFKDFRSADDRLRLSYFALKGVDTASLASEQAESWLQDLRQAETAQDFTSGVCAF